MYLWIKYLDRVIRGEANQPAELQEGDIVQPVGGLAILGMLLGVFYGLCMGCFGLFQKGGAAVLQLIATMMKVPLLFFLTLAVTFPSLYVFNALVGSRLTLLSVLRLLIISLAVMLTVLASLGPIVSFFSASTTSYPFMLLLNVVIYSISGGLGLRYLRTTLNRLSAALEPSATRTPYVPPLPLRSPDESTSALSPVPQGALPGPNPAKPPYAPMSALDMSPRQRVRKDVRAVFSVWMVVFGLVGGQMAWVLRPFLGNPHTSFTWFRGRESSFFEGVLHALHTLFR